MAAQPGIAVIVDAEIVEERLEEFKELIKVDAIGSREEPGHPSQGAGPSKRMAEVALLLHYVRDPRFAPGADAWEKLLEKVPEVAEAASLGSWMGVSTFGVFQKLVQEVDAALAAK